MPTFSLLPDHDLALTALLPPAPGGRDRAVKQRAQEAGSSSETHTDLLCSAISNMLLLFLSGGRRERVGLAWMSNDLAVCLGMGSVAMLLQRERRGRRRGRGKREERRRGRERIRSQRKDLKARGCERNSDESRAYYRCASLSDRLEKEWSLLISVSRSSLMSINSHMPERWGRG